ncbi:pyruvate dehydrogenase complex dihydrolipoamide acetyltransferase [Anaplasmataceae bacterium AB001_6]|nr:pyruvate dehydrogenase complex dihydrolipoamide acetyltransferase [Anaplasmataceae bacterium AB001_6]
MVSKLFMPSLSPTMESGKLIRWLKKESDSVELGDVLFEIETDKTVMEFEAPEDGVLAKIIVDDDTSNVPVNSLVGVLSVEGDTEEDIQNAINEAKSSSPAKIAESSDESTNVEVKSEVDSIKNVGLPEISTGDRIFITPVARNLANSKGVDITKIKPKRADGRIVKKDIEEFSQSGGSAISQMKNMPTMSAGKYTRVDITPMRKVIGDRLLQSKVTIPHFYLKTTCNVDKLKAFRKEIVDAGIVDVKITVNDFIVKAAAFAVRDIPDVNVSWADDHIKYFNTVDVAVAVAIEGGLITPIVSSADQKPLSIVSKEIKELIKHAKAGTLSAEQYQGGSLTVSNLGMYNVEEFYAIVNPPQSVILSVGSMIKKPFVDDSDNISVANFMTFTISCDHRVVDGAVAAGFLDRFKFYIENPLNILV